MSRTTIVWSHLLTEIGNDVTTLHADARRGNPEEMMDNAKRLQEHVNSLVAWLQLAVDSQRPV